MSKKVTKKSEPKKTTSGTKRGETKEPAALPSPEQIRDRAYQIFRSGVNPSDPVADWFQAERELKADRV
jgi:hypothetical protein